MVYIPIQFFSFSIYVFALTNSLVNPPWLFIKQFEFIVLVLRIKVSKKILS
jgi:hypothetical protein